MPDGEKECMSLVNSHVGEKGECISMITSQVGEKQCMSLVNSHVGEKKRVYKHDNFTSW